MAIPRKGSRKIIVDGRAYRWLIRPKGTDLQVDYGCGTAHVSVELLNAKEHSVLWIQTSRHHTSDIEAHTRPLEPVLPKDIAAWIQKAIQEGWKADARGPFFHLFIPLEEPS